MSTLDAAARYGARDRGSFMQGRSWLLTAAGLALGCLLAWPADAAGKRVALVIGISD